MITEEVMGNVVRSSEGKCTKERTERVDSDKTGTLMGGQRMQKALS
jgi:hypothetical protein